MVAECFFKKLIKKYLIRTSTLLSVLQNKEPILCVSFQWVPEQCSKSSNKHEAVM